MIKENQFNNQFNKKYKDRLFRLIFREKKDLLELYNAVNDSHHTNLDDLTITTIEDVVYMGMKNDLSFIVGDVMNLYEHQGSFSPNLPLRGLFYFASLYRSHIESVKQRLYMDLPLEIPFPQYLVFYNGTKEEPGTDGAVSDAWRIRPVHRSDPAAYRCGRSISKRSGAGGRGMYPKRDPVRDASEESSGGSRHDLNRIR